LPDRAEESLGRALAAAYGVDAAPLIARIDGAVGRARVRGGWDNVKVRSLLERWQQSFEDARRGALPTADEAIRDLEAWLGLKPARRAWRTGVSWVFEHATPVFTLLTVAGSAFFGLAYFRFYDALGLTPDEAGLGTAQVLARSVLGTLALLITISIGTYLLLLPFIPRLAAADLPAATPKPLSREEKLALLVLVVIDAVLLVVVSEIYFRVFPHAVILGWIAFMLLLYALVTFNVKIAKSWPLLRIGGFRPVLFRVRDFVAGFLFCVASVFALVTLVIHDIASDQATDAREGKAVRGWSFLSMPVLGVRAEPSSVAWKGTKPTGLVVPECVLYLGRKDNSLVVYDVVRKNTLRLSESDVVVSVRRDRTSCLAPINKRLPEVRRVANATARFECYPGEWENSDEESYRWALDGDGVDGADDEPLDARSYVRRGRRTVSCRVKATNAHGDDAAYSSPIPLPSEVPAEANEHDGG
jgi:hypothetical protein